MGNCLSGPTAAVQQEQTRTKKPTKRDGDEVKDKDRPSSPNSTTSRETHKTVTSPAASTRTSRKTAAAPEVPPATQADALNTDYPEIPVSTPVLTPNRQAERAPNRQAERAPNRQAERAPERQAERAPERQAECAPQRQAECVPQSQVGCAPETPVGTCTTAPPATEYPEMPRPEAADSAARQLSTASEGPHGIEDRPEIPRQTAISSTPGPSNQPSREISSATGRSTSVGLAPGAEKMITTVKAALDAWRLVYEEVPQEKLSNPYIRIIRIELATTYTRCTAVLTLDLEDEIFGVYYTCTQVKVVKPRLREVARYLTYANYDIMLGHFDLDFGDGELRFKVSEIVRGTHLSQEMVQQMVGVSLKTMDKYFPGLMACQFGNMSAEEGLDETRRVANQANTRPVVDAQ